MPTAREIIDRMRAIGGDVYLNFDRRLVVDLPDAADSPAARSFLRARWNDIRQEIEAETPTIEWLEQVLAQRGPNWGK